MKPNDVKARIAAMIDKCWDDLGCDDERAHIMEDELHQDVLKAIAAGAPNAEILAKEALKTLSLVFARWCA